MAQSTQAVTGNVSLSVWHEYDIMPMPTADTDSYNKFETKARSNYDDNNWYGNLSPRLKVTFYLTSLNI